MNNPTETLEIVAISGVAKATATPRKLAIFGLLAGIFIALAAAASSMAAMNLLANPTTYGLGRLVAGLVFVGGLACVIIAGAELFTGNALMLVAYLERRVNLRNTLKNWLIVLSFNILGGLLIALLISATGLFSQGANLYGAITIKIAAGKTALDFMPALISGILCNVLVCLAVFMAATAKTTGAKVAAILFPILFFVTMGFEHSVANAFYIPAGLLAANNPDLVASAKTIGANLSSLHGAGLFSNLVPVIIGNIIGGASIAIFYHFSLKKPKS